MKFKAKETASLMRYYHTLEPLYDEYAKILILGSFPSPKSREEGFYYANKSNRFWRIMSRVTGDGAFTGSVEEKKMACLRHGIALWDVVESCEISGASDSSIKEVKLNDFGKIFSVTGKIKVFTTGKTAYKLYSVSGESMYLPSTSSAYPVSEDFLAEKYAAILPYIIP